MTATAFEQSTSTGAGKKSVIESRGWAAAGLVAGLAGIASIQFSTAIDSVYTITSGDPQAIVADLATHKAAITGLHLSGMIALLGIVVFAAGLHRRLKVQAPAGSLLPAVASSGLGLVTVALLMGTGLDTEFLFGLGEKGLVPESAAFYGHWTGTIPWLWFGAGVSALAVAVAALRHSAAPRWIGWVSAVLGTVTTLFGISPLQYMAGFVGPVWLTIVAIGFLAGGRTSRAASRKHD